MPLGVGERRHSPSPKACGHRRNTVPRGVRLSILSWPSRFEACAGGGLAHMPRIQWLHPLPMALCSGGSRRRRRCRRAGGYFYPSDGIRIGTDLNARAASPRHTSFPPQSNARIDPIVATSRGALDGSVCSGRCPYAGTLPRFRRGAPQCPLGPLWGGLGPGAKAYHEYGADRACHDCAWTCQRRCTLG
jgi:hypothetical protein